MKRIIVTGGTGFIGTRLVELLQKKGYEVVVISRHAPNEKGLLFLKADLSKDIPHDELLENVHGVIHLAGMSIFGRWNEAMKKGIYSSRKDGTRNLVNAFQKVKKKPHVFISASAVGYYGDRKDELLDEKSESGKDFLAKVCRAWEEEASKAERLGMRWVSVRTALVLGENGGLLGILTPIFRWFIGGPLGNGKQWMPWIHVDDLVHTYLFLLESKNMRGPVNACAPEKVTNKEFSQTLGAVLRRPSFFPTYRWMLRIVLGEFADATLASQKVSSKKLQDAGFTFEYASLKKALRSIFRPKT